MKRILGVVTLLLTMYVLLYFANPRKALGWSNQSDVLNQQAFYGILTLGVGVLIISGGIDLSIGSVVGLSSVGFGVLMRDAGIRPFPAMLIVLTGGVAIGLFHGLLVTRLKLQPFLVTLCGLFIYRGIARIVGQGKTVGLGEILKERPDFTDSIDFLKRLLIGKDSETVLQFPMLVVVLLVLTIGVGILLHFSVFGRYWYAIGHNEQAARYAGINTERHRLSVFVLCSFIASLGGVLFQLDFGSATPQTDGESMELYAITGAVLGGCTLRGGEGTVIGMALGAAVLPLLKNLVTFTASVPFVQKVLPNLDSAVPVVIGLTLLLGTIVDEFFRRRSNSRK